MQYTAIIKEERLDIVSIDTLIKDISVRTFYSTKNNDTVYINLNFLGLKKEIIDE